MSQINQISSNKVDNNLYPEVILYSHILKFPTCWLEEERNPWHARSTDTERICFLDCSLQSYILFILFLSQFEYFIWLNLISLLWDETGWKSWRNDKFLFYLSYLLRAFFYWFHVQRIIHFSTATNPFHSLTLWISNWVTLQYISILECYFVLDWPALDWHIWRIYNYIALI